MNLAAVFILLGLFFCNTFAETGGCPKACTREYNPICGILKRKYGRGVLKCTFGNACTLQARRCQTGEQWIGKPGECLKNSAEC